MAEKVRQHTVPKVYQKNFGIARKKNTYVYVYDKSSHSIYQTDIKNVAVERNFYRLEASSNPLAVEDFYSQFVEPQTGEVIAEIIKKANLRVLSPNADVIPPKARAQLSISMLYQALRGRVAKDYMVSMTDSVLPDVEQKAHEFADAHQIQDAEARISQLLSDENILKAARIQASIDPNRIKNLAYYFYDRCWILYQIVGDAEFIASDNPVMLADNATKDATPFQHGLSSNTTVVYYPLSDKLMLALYSYGYADGVLNGFDNRIVRLDAVKENRFIRLVNTLQLDQCKKQAFAKSLASLTSIVGANVQAIGRKNDAEGR